MDNVLAIVAAIGLIAMSLIEALIASRTGNAIGSIFLALPLSFWASQVAQDLADYGLPRDEAYAEFTYWLTTWPFFLSLLLLVSVFYLFPTGHLPSRRWGWPWRAYVTAGIVTVVGFALLPYRPNEGEGGRVVRNPFGGGALEGILRGWKRLESRVMGGIRRVFFAMVEAAMMNEQEGTHHCCPTDQPASSLQQGHAR